MKRLTLILKDIKIEHTIFAMPFAVMSAFLASGGLPKTKELLLLLLALVFARSGAMAFNRLVDAKFDATNPRTKIRPLASGKAEAKNYIVFLIVVSAGFIFTTYFLNPLAFKLSPIALLIVFFYSLTKRFTSLSHLFLGIALSLAPIGAWIAIRGEVGNEALLLGVAVVFWLVGLDIIYSCQDVEHDKTSNLNSIPSKYGIKRALQLSSISHAVMITTLTALLLYSPNLGVIFMAGVIFTTLFLFYEHKIVRPNDLQKVNVAFFNLNGIISIGLMIFVIADTLK